MKPSSRTRAITSILRYEAKAGPVKLKNGLIRIRHNFKDLIYKLTGEKNDNSM